MKLTILLGAGPKSFERHAHLVCVLQVAHLYGRLGVDKLGRVLQLEQERLPALPDLLLALLLVGGQRAVAQSNHLIGGQDEWSNDTLNSQHTGHVKDQVSARS